MRWKIQILKALAVVLCLNLGSAFAQEKVRVVRPPVLQNQGEAGEALSGNYLIKLVLKDKDVDVTEISMVIATTRFRADTMQPTLSFSGTISPEDNGVMLVAYSLATQFAVPTQTVTGSGPASSTVQNIEYKSGSVQASVLMNMGEPVQILKCGSLTYQLTVSRLPQAAKKQE